MDKLDRVGEWRRFSKIVEDHIVSYTIKQYQSEDGTTDQVAGWNPQQCIEAIQRYINRFGKSGRGFEDQLRDMLKIAHYASFAYDKMVADNRDSLIPSPKHKELIRKYDIERVLAALLPLSYQEMQKDYNVENNSPNYYELSESLVHEIIQILETIIHLSEIKDE